jgi:hypothetical protein
VRVDNRRLREIIKVGGQEIHWGRGSAFNLGRIPGSSVRVERTRNDHGWSFLISNDEVTYLHVDGAHYETKEELDRGALDWIHRNKKLTI